MGIVTILVAILVFGLLIFVHELGHFLTAKRAGVTVNEFAMGMGPKLLSTTRGETTYSLRLFPIGGFCAMEGENEDSEDTGAFCNAKLYKRILITVAGSCMNLLLGLILLGILSSQQELLGTTKIAQFIEGAVSNASLQVGDEVVEINGRQVRNYNDLRYQFSRDWDGVMDMEVIRDGASVLLPSVTFGMEEMEDGSKIINLDFWLVGTEPTFFGVVQDALGRMASFVKMVWGSFADLIMGRVSVDQLSGPVGVTTVIGEATSMGWESLLRLVAFITVNLGVFNLMPLPALDGGRLIFLLVELVRRKPVAAKYEGLVHAIGFVLLIGLMVFVTVNDIIKLV
jgi:regulator of sigma E protease